MFKKMNKRNAIIISTLMIVVAVLMYTLPDSFNENVDLEVAQFFSGLFFGIGVSILISVFFRSEKQKEKN